MSAEDILGSAFEPTMSQKVNHFDRHPSSFVAEGSAVENAHHLLR
jgi:hypothetical protein